MVNGWDSSISPPTRAAAAPVMDADSCKKYWVGVARMERRAPGCRGAPATRRRSVCMKPLDFAKPTAPGTGRGDHERRQGRSRRSAGRLGGDPGRMAGLVGKAPRQPTGRVAALSQEGERKTEHRLERSSRGGALFRLDRQSDSADR